MESVNIFIDNLVYSYDDPDGVDDILKDGQSKQSIITNSSTFSQNEIIVRWKKETYDIWADDEKERKNNPATTEL